MGLSHRSTDFFRSHASPQDAANPHAHDHLRHGSPATSARSAGSAGEGPRTLCWQPIGRLLRDVMSDQHDAVQLRVASPGIAPRQPAESPGAQREYRGPAIDQSASARERSVELRQRFCQHGQLSDIRAAVDQARLAVRPEPRPPGAVSLVGHTGGPHPVRRRRSAIDRPDRSGRPAYRRAPISIRHRDAASLPAHR